MKHKIALFSATIACLASVAPANAATLLFDLTGSRTATFQIDTERTPDVALDSVFGAQIQFNNVQGTFGGVAGTAPSIGFGNGLFADLNINGTVLGFTQFVSNPEIFSGPATAPVFALGTFNLTSIVSGRSTLTISQVAAAVPEPGTWLTMILGFAMIGAALRYRKQTTTVRFALAR